MDYNMDILKAELDSLIGKAIKNAYYFSDYENYEVFDQMPHEIVEIPLLGMLVETNSNELYNIISLDYSPYYGLGGVRLFRSESLTKPQGRPNQITESFWGPFRDKLIKETEIIETRYKTSEMEIAIPFAIKLTFSEDKVCYIANISVDGFEKSTNKYEFSRGDGLGLIAGDEIFDQYEILKQDTFYI